MAAILLLCLYVFGATDAYQLLKLPKFVQHYVEHRHENPNLSLADFIQIHYQDQLVIDADFQQDMQLPFKTHNSDCCVAMSIATIVPAPIEVKINAPEQVTVVHILFNDDVPLLHAAPSVFQPPKVA